jgi:hypothetical protein
MQGSQIGALAGRIGEGQALLGQLFDERNGGPSSRLFGRQVDAVDFRVGDDLADAVLLFFIDQQPGSFSANPTSPNGATK